MLTPDPAEFVQRLRQWRPELRAKEKAAILGVELDTFRGWLYKHTSPRAFVRRAVLILMRDYDEGEE